MRKTLVMAMLACTPLFCFAQPNKVQSAAKSLRKFVRGRPYAWDAGIQLGASNYLGDMGGKDLSRRDFVSDMKLSQTHFAGGGYARYKFNQFFALKTSVNYLSISGADSLSANAARNARNLSFRNRMAEANVQGQYVFYEVNDVGGGYQHKNFFRAYVGLGIGALYHNPQAYYQGEWNNLRPLTTEGQDRPYRRVVLVAPASAGFHFTLNRNYRIGWEVCWRTAFTDYLDDVSRTYADESELPNPLAVALANRTDEKNNLTPDFAMNFTPGNKRGDANHNDSYLSTSIEMGYVFRGHSAIKSGGTKGPSKFGGPRSKVRHIIF